MYRAVLVCVMRGKEDPRHMHKGTGVKQVSGRAHHLWHCQGAAGGGHQTTSYRRVTGCIDSAHLVLVHL